jgi:hypothetical protein
MRGVHRFISSFASPVGGGIYGELSEYICVNRRIYYGDYSKFIYSQENIRQLK